MAEAAKDGLLRKLARSEQAAGIQRLSVYALVPLMGLLGWFVQDEWSGLRTNVDALTTSLSALSDKVTDDRLHIAAIESSRTERIKSGDQFQTTMLNNAAVMQGAISLLQQQVAAMSAKLDTVIDQKHAEIVPPGMR